MTLEPVPRILHVVVGHKLPTMFLNAVRSICLLAPADDLLVVDNASQMPQLRAEFQALEQRHSQVHVMFRGDNDVSTNQKVGGLYDAYRDALAYAFDNGYDLLHLMQGDMQMVFWDRQVVFTALELFERYPECVNIHTTGLPRDRRLGDDLALVGSSLLELTGYGLSDTGLVHLDRWRALGLRFHDSETSHARAYLQAGLRVLCHPCPPVAQVPWPAVVRENRVRGKEVEPVHAFLLRPLGSQELAELRNGNGHVWLEDICVPWGWSCLVPMWPTALESIDYWVYRYWDLRQNGVRAALPRWDRRGLAAWTGRPQRRPSLWDLALAPPLHELRRRLLAWLR